MSKSLIFLVKTFLGNFYRHLATFCWSHWPHSNNTNDKIKQFCTKLEGLQNIGYQSEPNINLCRDPELQRVEFGSKNVERSVVSTYGSFPASNGSDWIKSVMEMHASDSLRWGTCQNLHCSLWGQSFKAPSVVNYDSRVVISVSFISVKL